MAINKYLWLKHSNLRDLVDTLGVLCDIVNKSCPELNVVDNLVKINIQMKCPQTSSLKKILKKKYMIFVPEEAGNYCLPTSQYSTQLHDHRYKIYNSQSRLLNIHHIHQI